MINIKTEVQNLAWNENQNKRCNHHYYLKVLED